MANGGYITANLANDMSGTTPETAFPKTNLYDGNASRPCRWNAATITITVTASGNCTGIGICGHNLKAGATCTINSVSVTVHEGQSIWYKFPSATNSAVIAIGSSGVAKVGIGEIVMGVVTEFGSNFSYGWNESRAYQNDVHETEYGVQLIYEKWNTGLLQLQFNNMSSIDVSDLRALYQSCRGNYTPLLLVLDSTSGPCYFGRFRNNFTTTYTTLGRNTSVLEFGEDPIGAFLS